MYQSKCQPTLGRFPHYPAGVPDELKTDTVWVSCDSKKVPMIASTTERKTASSTDPQTWRTYEEALQAFETGRYAGVGRVIEASSDYVGIDLDKCRDPVTGEITARAWEILKSLNSYSEVSPSLTGVKVWLRADLKIAHVKPSLECYPRGRYFTVTGQLLPQFSTTVEERTRELLSVIAAEFPKPEKKAAWTGPLGKTLDLVQFLEIAGIEPLAVLADTEAEVKYRILCPWVAEHTNGDESGTYLGQYPDGALFFHCWHAHCRHRDWADFKHKTCLPKGRRSKARRVWRRSLA